MRERPGWTWKGTSSGGGFWMKQQGDPHQHKLNLFCPHCKRPTGTIDDKHLQEHGICAKCFVLYVESRKVPAIDLSKYQKNKQFP